MRQFTVSITCWLLGVLAGSPATASVPGSATTTTSASELGAIVEMSAAKREAAQLATAPVAVRALRPQRVVPGRLGYDERRHVEIRTAAAGFVAEILVTPGDRVEAGRPLAVVSSPEVGDARADVLQRQADYEIARRALKRAEATHKAASQIAEAIRQGKPLEELGVDSQAAAMGAHGEVMISAYADSLIAGQLHRNIQPIASQGVVSGRLLMERRIDETRAQSSLKATVESALFAAEIDRAKAINAADDARRRQQISQERVASLLGYDKSPTAPTRLSQFEVRAPFAGVVESIHRSSSERLAAGEPLMTFADTTQLWVTADIREPEWAALDLKAGDEVAVSVPVVNRDAAALKAVVHYVGRQVSLETNAVPLIAVIDNQSARLRPGQYVRVQLPLAAPRDGLAVPESALLENNREKFVFVEVEPGRYRRAAVTTGLVDGGWVEVTSGLHAGEAVVSHGAFALKSEQLLETLAE